MKTISTILFHLILVFFSTKAQSQQISWNQINSSNAIDITTIQNLDFKSYSSALQVGDFNKADLFINDNTSISLQQIGDYNTLYYINSFTDTEVRTVITIQGHNNIIDITGSNSISENLRLNVKGDNRTIFMRNY